jgi:hypothetical protein
MMLRRFMDVFTAGMPGSTSQQPTALLGTGLHRRKLMPVFKRELAFAADRPLENAGDWWHLVLDTDAPGLYVEHTWMHPSSHLDGQADQGSQRFGINDFLTLAEGRPAQPMLMSALREIFRSAAPTSE